MRELIVRTGTLPTLGAMHLSRCVLDAPLAHDVELTVTRLADNATVLGAFQRPHGLPNDAKQAPLMRRGSGGPFVTVGPGTLHVLLALSHAGALVPCDPARFVNRCVRPLLRALTKAGALAHYFGRDWVSVAHRPVAEVGFAHDSTTGRAAFEALVAVGSPFASAGRASFMGKEPGTLESLTGRVFDPNALTELIVQAYAAAGNRVTVREPLVLPEVEAAPLEDPPPWAATVIEAIGELGAGADAAGVFRLGGDLLASRDALSRVAARAAALEDGDMRAMGQIVNDELTRPEIALEGIRELRSVSEVLLAAQKG